MFCFGENSAPTGAKECEKKASKLTRKFRAELNKNRQLLLREAEQSRLNLQLAWERIQISETAVEQANENLRITKDSYEVGMETITELLIAQTQWQQAINELIDSKTDFKIKETIWKKTTGKLGSGS